MSIIPCGKSNLFNSELDEFKNKYVAQYAKEALDSIPRLEVDGQRHVCEPQTKHEACGCGDKCVDEVVIKKKRKKDMPLRKVVKEGDEMEASASVDTKYISLAELKQTFSKMDKLDKDKIYAFWSEILGEDFAKALVKEYF